MALPDRRTSLSLIRPRAAFAIGQRQRPPAPRQPVETRMARSSSSTGGFASAGGGGLYGDFQGAWGQINWDLRTQLPMMRARSRQQMRDNEYAKAFGRAVLNNVLGSEGIKFDIKIRDPDFVKDGKTVTGDLDVFANKVIKEARAKFERPENYTVRRRTSRLAAHRLFLLCLVRDGEIFIRKIKGFQNDFKFSLQLIPPEAVDINLNQELSNGNKIVMGIEFDNWGAPAAYHVLTKMQQMQTVAFAGNFGYSGGGYGEHERVLAADMIHVFVEEEPLQARGVPWLQAAMQKLHQLGAYEEAAIINARIGASKVVYYEKEYPEGFFEKTPEEQEELYGRDCGFMTENLEPGTSQELPRGVKPVAVNPTYPDAQFDPFVKAALRGIAAAIGTSYMTLSNDLNGTSFSSGRIGLNDERENWKSCQVFWDESFCAPEFSDWLYMSLANQKIPLPAAKFDKFNAPIYTGRRWGYVNPMQDAQADALRLQMRQTSHQRIAREAGEDFEEIVQEIEDDDTLLKNAGLTAAEGASLGAPPVNGSHPKPDSGADGTDG